MGHSDNYIEANSMQTPASIIINKVSVFVLLIYTFYLVFKFKLKMNWMLKFNNKEEVFQYLEDLKRNCLKDNPFNSSEFMNSFKYLANGIFQAEGHIGGYFTPSKLLNFRPIVFIGITVNIESLKFLVLLNSQFNWKMQYNLEKLPSGRYYIKLYSRDWDFIINTFIPYFNKIYGDKYKGLKRLQNMYLLLFECKKKFKNNKFDNLLIEKIILLGYHLVDHSKRKIFISKYLSLYNIEMSQAIDFLVIEENKELINPYFLLGLILGDGSLSIRIRESKRLPWFIPSVRINQKITDNNKIFLNQIQYTLIMNGISSHFVKSGHLYYLSITSTINVEKLSQWLPNEEYWWFWKKEEYLILKKALLLMKLKATHWQTGKKILLNLLYDIFKYKKPLEYWQKLIRNSYDNKKNYYISLSKNIAWSVKLPIKIKPKVKFFFFKTYGSKDKALSEAIKYRDEKLNLWLKENKLIK